MKTVTLVTLLSFAAVAALFFLPVDLDVQASVAFAAGIFSILFSEYSTEPKKLTVDAEIISFSAGRTEMVEAA
jgi:hypothetical protein